MEKPKKYFFIDESGDAAFYSKGKNLLVGTSDFKPVLLLGMIEVEEKEKTFSFIKDFEESIKKDPLYNTLRCVTDPKGWYLHAKNDQLEIRTKFVEALRKEESFKTFVIIGRKRLSTFSKTHKSSESEFYFDMVSHLLKDRLFDDKFFYQIILSSRSGNDSDKLKKAIIKAIERNKKRTNKELNIEFDYRTAPSSSIPELSIVDYMLWALQRYISGKDSRFYLSLKDKYSLILDFYDTKNFGKNYYNKNNPFLLEKASPFRMDGYI